MKYGPLGSSGVQVSEVCLGTMTWGEQNTEAEAWEQLDAFVEAGGNFIDTAELYPVPPVRATAGRTERFIGNWLASKPPGFREKLVIATKVAGPCSKSRDYLVAFRREATGGGAGPADDLPQLSPAQIADGVDASLKRLQIESIDLIQLHWPERYTPTFGKSIYSYAKARKNEHDVRGVMEMTPFEEQLRGVAAVLKAGKVKHWGVSNETTFGVCKLCELAKQLGMPPPVSIQNDFSLLDRRFETELSEACAPWNHNLGLMVYGGLSGGYLSGKYLAENTASQKYGSLEGTRHSKFPNFQARYHKAGIEAATRQYANIAEAAKLTPTQLALAFCKSRPYVCTTIIGATSMKQLKECIEAFDIELSADVLKEIDEVHHTCRNPQVTDPLGIL